tara:strand:- start:718 stop:1296 length:579 start_codon:yes stop_codon:yes gene_type:complete
VYLFDKNVSPLQGQKNNRELENMVQESILISIRESIPTEAIIRAYMDESVEQEEEVIIEDVEEEEEVAPQETPIVKEKSVEDEPVPEVVPSIQNIDNEEVVTKLSFNDLDAILDENDDLKTIDAPKSIERLEEISTERAMQRHLEEESDDDDRLQISTEQINLHDFDELGDIAGSETKNTDEIILNDVEELY